MRAQKGLIDLVLVGRRLSLLNLGKRGVVLTHFEREFSCSSVGHPTLVQQLKTKNRTFHGTLDLTCFVLRMLLVWELAAMDQVEEEVDSCSLKSVQT